MDDGERSEFLEWYETQKAPFDKRRVLQQYCQNDVAVFRQACRVYPREFMQVGNLDAYLKSISVASACKKFLQPDTIGHIPAGVYTCKKNYSKKLMMWLLHMEQGEGVKILHGRNGRE